MKHTINLTSDELQNSDYRKFIISIRLDDECKNGHEDFAITASGWNKDSFRKDSDIGGCCHDEILQLRPDLKPFVDLHLSDAKGAPMYAVENGFYHLKSANPFTCLDYLRITADELTTLQQCEDKEYFSFMLESLGIVARWEKEAKEGIKLLESLTGEVFTDHSTRYQYTPLTDEQKDAIKGRIFSGYYLPENIKARQDQKQKDLIQSTIDKLNQDSAEKINKINAELKIMLYLVACGLPIDNVIYYTHSNELKFNWQNSRYRSKLTADQFDSFMSQIDLTQFPEGVKISMK